ncbi:MAG: type IX secretion system sortase PorU [Prolixibacteraceae bacterium]
MKWDSSKGSFETSQVQSPNFDGSVSLNQDKLPYWFESFTIHSSQADVSILNAEFEPVANASFLDADRLGDELQIHSEVGISAGQAILKVTVLPFVKRNGQVLKLVDFTLSINESNNPLKSAQAAYSWKSSSVLSSGNWIKIKTKNRGFYKITYDQLKTWGFASPEKVSVYGAGGLMLPVLNKDISFDDLPLYPVLTGKDNAGKDCIFFYSTGNIGFKQNQITGFYTHQQNYFSTETFFYLSDQGNPEIIEKAAEISGVAGRKVSSFTNYAYYEKELVNLLSSGSQWFGEHFLTGSSQTFNLTLDNCDVSKPIQFVTSLVGRSSSSSSFDVVLNGKKLNPVVFQAYDSKDATSEFAYIQKTESSESLSSKNIQVKLTYNASNSSSDAWLDYLAVNFESQLNVNSDVYFFNGRGASGQDLVSEFIINGATATTKIIDITDFQNAVEIPTVFESGQLKFKSNSLTFHEYVAINPTGTIPVPEFAGNVANQNLHASDVPEMIIVTYPGLQIEADKLANYHRETDNMDVSVVTPEEIYNEFSGGLPDAAGIRNYFRSCYEKGKINGVSKLKYVLLMGDGTYDNRNILEKNMNLIPTYQSENSLSPVRSYVTDDFYAFLDENEGDSSGVIDLGIGRIPARILADAQTVVEKVMNYKNTEAMGNWRNVLAFIGDDGDSNTHMSQAEELATIVSKKYPSFYSDKIYLDAFKQLSTSSGERYPDVTTAINTRVKKGTLIMNYTGHANEKNLADENVLDIGGINSWTNINRLPLFVTATCEFSRFDGNETSAGEYILFNPVGGGVGLFSTTRLVYSGANSSLNKAFFNYIFEKDQQGNQLRLGDVMRLAKAYANTGTNQLNFSLLADPAMLLANPVNQVKTTSMDGHDVNIQVDTIKTLSVVTVKGFVADSKGEKLSSFNGEIIPTVYDKAMKVETLGNAGETPMSYTVQNNVIYKGLASVVNGEFEFSFFVPKDISYKLDKGKILYYASNETTDAQGYFDGFYIGGASNNSVSESEGPKIDLFLNSESFQDGGRVSASSVLLANITDATGINTAGTGIGHDITAVLDGDYSMIMVLNDYFQSDKDSYTSGKIVFPLSNLAEGEHVLTLKVWDVLNNSSEKEIRFVVKDDFRIEQVSCYPNPMQGEAKFSFTHNQPDEAFDVNLEIFQTSGARVDNLLTSVGSIGTESLPFEWIPANRNVKMKAGVYIYRLSVTTKDGKSTSGSGRLVYVYR